MYKYIIVYINYICTQRLKGKPVAEGERHRETGRGTVRWQGTARSWQNIETVIIVTRQVWLCLCDNDRQRKQQLQVN